MAEKLSVSEMLRLACIHAEYDRRDFADCNKKDSPEAIEATALADALHKYRMKRWGRTMFEKAVSEADTVDARTGVITKKGSHPEASDEQ